MPATRTEAESVRRALCCRARSRNADSNCAPKSKLGECAGKCSGPASNRSMPTEHFRSSCSRTTLRDGGRECRTGLPAPPGLLPNVSTLSARVIDQEACPTTLLCDDDLNAHTLQFLNRLRA